MRKVFIPQDENHEHEVYCLDGKGLSVVCEPNSEKSSICISGDLLDTDESWLIDSVGEVNEDEQNKRMLFELGEFMYLKLLCEVKDLDCYILNSVIEFKFMNGDSILLMPINC